MHRTPLVVAALVSLAPLLSACGGGDVAVRVVQEGGGEGNVQPVADLPVQFLPYDRDSIFDALTAAAEEPEPQVPEALQEALDSVRVLQEQWREAETEWADVRDELQQLSNRLQNMDPRSREYRQLFERFNQLEGREQQLNQAKNQAFERFDSLQTATLERADSVRAVRDSWADIAYQDYVTIVDSILEAEGVEVREDTTDADGYATVSLPNRRWWVHTRTDVPFGELYWNVPVEPAETDTLVLDPENAERRLRL